MYLNLPHLPHLEVLFTADYINFEILEENTCLFFDFSLVFLHFHSEKCVRVFNLTEQEFIALMRSKKKKKNSTNTHKFGWRVNGACGA